MVVGGEHLPTLTKVTIAKTITTINKILLKKLKPVLMLMKFYPGEMKILTTVLDGNVSCQCYREKSESKNDTEHVLEKFHQ